MGYAKLPPKSLDLGGFSTSRGHWGFEPEKFDPNSCFEKLGKHGGMMVNGNTRFESDKVKMLLLYNILRKNREGQALTSVQVNLREKLYLIQTESDRVFLFSKERGKNWKLCFLPLLPIRKVKAIMKIENN